MSYTDSNPTAEHVDSVRRSHFERATSRPSSKLARSPVDERKPHQRASGRLRTAAWRCSLDAKRRPESDVVGLALLAAVATKAAGYTFDPDSVSIIADAFADLINRGYERSEIEAVFRRFRKNLYVAPEFTTNENGGRNA
jgi:hypothetical protein